MILRDNRHVLIVEPNPDGHRLHYVALLVREILSEGAEVSIATATRTSQSDEWNMKLGGFAAQIAVEHLTVFNCAEIRSAATRLRVDHVVIPDGDSYAYALAVPGAWAGPITVSVLVMRPSGQPSKIPGLAGLKTAVKRSVLFVANSRRTTRIYTLKSATWRGFSILPAVRDPVTTHRTVERRSVLPGAVSEHRYWFGVVGVVGYRKNLPMVAEALSGLDCSKIGLVIAGRVEPGVLQAAHDHLQRVRQAGGMVKIIDRLLGDQELDQLIAEVDCVVLAHSNEGSSGVFGKAAALGTRVVASGAKSLREDCRGIPSGSKWVPLKAGAIRKAMSQATRIGSPSRSVVASPSDFAQSLLQWKSASFLERS